MKEHTGKDDPVYGGEGAADATYRAIGNFHCTVRQLRVRNALSSRAGGQARHEVCAGGVLHALEQSCRCPDMGQFVERMGGLLA